jgi:acetoin utilization protein AcuB
MNVRQYMQARAVTVAPDAPISQARDLMEEHGFGLLLVASGEGVLAGFVTRAGLKEITDWEAPVHRFSHPAKFAVSPEDTLEKAALILLANRLVVLPVVQEERLVGVLTQGELLKGLTHGLGIGLEATRLTVKVRSNSEDLYDVFAILRAHGARIVSLAQAGTGDGTCEIVLRIQGIEEKERLRTELETALKSVR